MSYSIFADTMVDMPWVEVEQAIRAGALVLLPTGVIEEHGPHLPLGTDTYTAWLLCAGVRQSLEARGIQALIAPPCYWGINQATGGFPGSFSVRPETFKAVLMDLLANLKAWGVTRVYNINGHGDPAHEAVIFEALLEAQTTLGIHACAVREDYTAPMMGLTGSQPHIIFSRTPPMEGEEPPYAEIHAGAIETALMLRHFPELVNAALAKTLEPTRLTYADIPAWQQGGGTARALTPNGYFGDPAGYEAVMQAVLAYYDALPALFAEAIAADAQAHPSPRAS